MPDELIPSKVSITIRTPGKKTVHISGLHGITETDVEYRRLRTTNDVWNPFPSAVPEAFVLRVNDLLPCEENKHYYVMRVVDPETAPEETRAVQLWEDTVGDSGTAPTNAELATFMAAVVKAQREADGLSTAIRDIVYERSTHAQRGWTPEHDAEHGTSHLIYLAQDRLWDQDGNTSRTRLVKAASLLVAAIELMDGAQ